MGVRSSEALEDEGANESDEVAGVPAVLIQKLGECCCAFDLGVFGSGIAGGVEEACDEYGERLRPSQETGVRTVLHVTQPWCKFSDKCQHSLDHEVQVWLGSV